MPDHVRRQFSGRRAAWQTLFRLALVGAFVALLFAPHRRADMRAIYLVANLLAVALIIALLSGPGGLLAKLIGSRPLRYVGRISYCLYLCHLLVRNLLYHYLLGLPTYVYVLLTFAVSFAIASASWWLLEARVLKAAWPRRISRVAGDSRLRKKKAARRTLYLDQA